MMKRHNKVILGVFMLVLVTAMLLGDTVYATGSTKTIKSISWKKYNSALTINKGEQVKLAVKFSPKKKINKTLKWKSSKKKVVSVNSKGVIKGKKKGTSTITASTTDGSNKKIKLKVTVGQKVTSVEFTNTAKMDKIYTGKKYTIKTSVEPANASNKGLIWSSSDESIAKVSSKGVVTPVTNGFVVISAKAADGSGVKFEEEFQVATLVSSVSLSFKSGTPYQVAVGSNTACVKGGSSIKLNSSVSPDNATDKTLLFESSNDNVARVGDDGIVYTYGSGISVITATAADGSKKSAKLTIYVDSYDKEDCTFVAHRGFSELAPDNSLASFRLAMENGFEYIELDIWQTIDNQFAICHNKSLKDTTGDDVNITDITLSQVMSHRINTGNGIATYSSEYIPSLEQVLALAVQYPDSKLNIEIKDTLSVDLLKSLLEIIDTYGMHDRVRIISFKKANLTLIRTLKDEGGEDIELGYLTQVFDQAAIDTCEKLNAELGATYIQMSKDAVRAAHDRGVRVNAWTVPNIYMAGFLIDTVKVDSITANYKFFK